MRTVTIGRGPDCDIVLDDPYASSRHCMLVESAFRVWTVRDLGSTNGTTVIRSGRAHRLTMGDTGLLISGDVLVVGRTRMPPFTPERVAS